MAEAKTSEPGPIQDPPPVQSEENQSPQQSEDPVNTTGEISDAEETVT